MVSSWQLLIGLFALIVATSLQDLNEDSQRNSKAAWEWTLDNNDDSSAGRLGLPTTTEPSEITQLLPGGGGGGGDVMRSDITISNGSGGGGGRCASFNNGLSRRRIRARDEKSCVEKNFLPFGSSGEEEEEEANGRQLLPPPVRPNAQQQGGGGDGGGQNSGGGGSGEPKFRVVLPRMNDLLQFQFLPRDNRPKRDSQHCPDPLRPFPICGRPGDSYITSNRIAPGLVVDPAYLYLAFGGCISVEGDRIGYCCQYADAAYAWDELSKTELDTWRVLLESGGDVLRKVEERLMSGARSPYKLVGLDCKPIELEGTEGRRPTPF